METSQQPEEPPVDVSLDFDQTSDLNAMVDVMTPPSETTTMSTSAVATTTRSSNFLYIVEPLANITINSGKEVRLKCHVKGNPSPKFRWFKNEAPFEPEKRGRITIKKEHDGSKIRIRNLDVPDTGYYRCEATNGFQKVETTGVLKVLMVHGRPPPPLDIEELETDYAEMTHISEDAQDLSFASGMNVRPPDVTAPGICQPYRGTACSKFLKNSTVYIGHAQTQTQVEDSLIAAFTSIPKHTELSTQCTEYAVPSLCYHMFPVCDEGTAKRQPRQLCRDECELLESEICRKEYAIANGHPVLKQFMPDCARLPREQSVDHRKCVRLGLRPAKQTKLTQDDCYTGNGESYHGMVKHTVSGTECKKWDGVHHSDLAHHNFCRNPGGFQAKPWCFNGKTDAVEACNLPKCARPADETFSNLLYIAVPVGAILLLVLLISSLYCICRRMKRKERKQSFKANIKANPLELNALIPKYHIHGSAGQVPEIQFESLQFRDTLGDGTYGKVFTADITSDGCIRPVLVRMLKENGNFKIKQDFQRELSQWADFRHPNVAMLVGAHTSRDPFAMIFEHTKYVDLHEHLEAMPDRSLKSLNNMDVGVNLASEYLHLATQVASGMEFLAANGFVHRDLATKNCWVFESGIKVADHGVGPTRYPSDYARVQNHILPVRWMAPESINYGQTTLHSNVWSFGVLMWEIWTEGMQPYYGHSLTEILEMIRTRQLLPQPEDCPANIYALMVECWHENTVRRPSFKELSQRLWNWEHGYLASTGNDMANGGRPARSTVSQHSSNPGSHSNNTGSTHVSNGLFPNNLPQFTFAALPNSPVFTGKFSNNLPRRLPVQTQTLPGLAGNMTVPPSPLLRTSALNTPLFKGPRLASTQAPVLNNLNFDSFRTTNL